MIKKIRAGFTLLKLGQSVADPAKWKNRQITATMLTGIIWAAIQLAESFGYGIPVDEATIDSLAIGILAAINWLLTLSTSKTVGLRDKVQADSDQ
jgi:hypothetical protein